MADQASAVPFDEAPVTRRYWLSIILFAVTGVVDFFDFFVVGFLVSVLAPKWHLTFGQTSIMLMSAGIGAMLGALASGFLADRFGRKPLAVAGVLICGLSSGAIALIPEDGWIFFAILRFFVGFGLAAGAAAAVPAIVEFAPTRHRTLVTSLVVVPVAFGVLSASITASYLLPLVGWRGLAAVGFLPIILAILTAFVMPESPRWLISKGRVREATVCPAGATSRKPRSVCRFVCRTTAFLADGADLVRRQHRQLWRLPMGTYDRRPVARGRAPGCSEDVHLCQSCRRARPDRVCLSGPSGRPQAVRSADGIWHRHFTGIGRILP